MTTVRDAAPEDAQAVMAAHVSAIETSGPDAYDGEQVAAWAERPSGADPYRENARADGEVFVVAERAGDLAGFGHFVLPEAGEADAKDRRPDEGEVTAVYVHGDHARTGVGSAILEHLESQARDRGVESLVLTSSTNAVGFYERHHFEPIRPDVHETTGGVPLDVAVMRKRLGDGGGSE